MLASTLRIWKNGYKDPKRRYMSILSGELWHALPLWLNDLKCTLFSVLWTKKETAWHGYMWHMLLLLQTFLFPVVLLPHSFSVNAPVLAFWVPSPPIQFDFGHFQPSVFLPKSTLIYFFALIRASFASKSVRGHSHTVAFTMSAVFCWTADF